MDITLLLGAFLAGIITVFAPCVFALLPVIVGGSMTGDVHDKRRPFLIAGSLAISLILFTLLLKATTLFIDISPAVITYASGGIIVGLGLVTLFPQLYEKFILLFNLQARSQRLLGKSTGRGPVIGAIITGAALGPVFSSCSPVYAYILATVLPVNFNVAIVYVIMYVIGLSIMMLLLGFLGQKLVRKIRFAVNPKGWFQRVVAILFILVGLSIMTGYDKQFQTFISEKTPFNFDALSSKLIPDSGRESAEGVLNVKSYKAPEIAGIKDWINSDPQTIEGLKGKVVLIDFWTYSCINCIRTQPYLKSWYETYKDSGLEIIGVHAPEFSFEKNKVNVEDAAKKAGLTYPIALDNDFTTWNAYKNQYWPASYLIDKDGNVRRVHAGEGGYKETEQAIRQLLAEKGGRVPNEMASVNGGATSSDKETPETYLGTRRANNYTGPTRLIQGQQQFTAGSLDKVNNWTLGGTWNVTSEGITAVANSTLKFRIAAKDVYMVTGSNTAASIGVTLNGTPIGQTKFAGSDIKDSKLDISMAQLYRIADFGSFNGDQTIELTVPAGVQLNTFTFGS
ncbi:cytochrome c biogenesis protein DipZ [bacterium]|nr:MAG: cytochrome c biogenesis protein DipZ [bacterium]